MYANMITYNASCKSCILGRRHPRDFSLAENLMNSFFMYLEAVGKGFFSKLNIEPLISLQKMTQKVKNANIST